VTEPLDPWISLATANGWTVADDSVTTYRKQGDSRAVELRRVVPEGQCVLRMSRRGTDRVEMRYTHPLESDFHGYQPTMPATRERVIREATAPMSIRAADEVRRLQGPQEPGKLRPRRPPGERLVPPG
jgi:hypothetical protein